MFTIESVARILVITKESGTFARKTGSPFVQFISREINQATSSLTFSTRNSILETRDSILDPRDSRLDPRNYRGSSIESRGSRIDARGTVNLLLSGTVQLSRNLFSCFLCKYCSLGSSVGTCVDSSLLLLLSSGTNKLLSNVNSIIPEFISNK